MYNVIAHQEAKFHSLGYLKGKKNAKGVNTTAVLFTSDLNIMKSLFQQLVIICTKHQRRVLTRTKDVHGVVEVLLYGPVHGPVLPLVRASTSASALRRRHDVAHFTSAVKRQTYPWKQPTVLLLTARGG